MTTATYSPPQKPIDSTLLRWPEVEARSGLKRAAIYARIAAGLLPRPGWPAREITAVNEALIQGRSDDEIRHLVANLVAKRTAGPE